MLRGGRKPQGGEGLLYGIGRHVEARALAHPSAIVREPVGDSEDGRGTPAVGRHRGQREHRYCDGGDRPVTPREIGSLHAPAHVPHTHSHAGESHEPVFVGPRRAELDEILTRYPTRMAALLPALWIVQNARGWISEPAMAEVAQALELTPAYVKGVVTFYTMYHQHPVGRHFIQV